MSSRYSAINHNPDTGFTFQNSSRLLGIQIITSHLMSFRFSPAQLTSFIIITVRFMLNTRVLIPQQAAANAWRG